MTVNVVSFLFSWCWGQLCWLSLLHLISIFFLYCILSASSLDPNSSGPQAPSTWCGFLYHILSPTLLPLARRTQLALNSTQLSSFCSIHQPFITFKLPRGDMDTPPQFLPISGDRDVSLPLSLEWPVWSSSSGNNCHAVQRSLSSGASVYESIMGFFFFFLPRPILSANFRPRDFLSQLPLECVTSFRCITLNGIFGWVKRSKHNTITQLILSQIFL